MITIDKEKQIALVKVLVPAENSTIISLAEELINHPDHVDGMDEVWWFCRMSTSVLTADKLKMLAVALEKYKDRLSKRIVYVVEGDLDYGVGRMWEIYSGDAIHEEQYLCRTLDEAYKWLGK